MHSVHDHLTMFLTAKRAAGLSPRTIETYQRSIGYFLTWLAGREFSRQLVRAYIIELQDRQLSPASISAYIRDIIVWGNWLVDEEIIETNPARKLKPRQPRRRPAAYTASQLHALLRDASLRDRAIMLTLLDTGLRASELVQLRRSSIDPRSGHFVIVGKGNAERSGWVSPVVVAAIREYIAERRDTDPALWVGERGQPLTAGGIHQIIARRAEAAGIREDVRRLVHSFRATFAQLYVQRGGDLRSLADLLGHASITMSAHYAQLADDQLATKKHQINPLASILSDVSIS